MVRSYLRDAKHGKTTAAEIQPLDDDDLPF
jgi:hypothetical protein